MSQDDLGSRESQRPPRRHRRSAWLAGLGAAAGVVLAVGVVTGISAQHGAQSGSPPSTPEPAASTGGAESTPSSVPTLPVSSTYSLANYLSSAQGVEDFSTLAQTIDGTVYKNSFRFTVLPAGGQPSYVVFNVTGSRLLTAIVGVPSDSVNDNEGAVAVKFYGNNMNNQLNAATVNADRPKNIRLNLQGITKLVIACTATNSAGQQISMTVAFGDAILRS